MRAAGFLAAAFIAVLLVGCDETGMVDARDAAVQAEVLRQYAERLPDWAAESKLAQLEEAEDKEGKESGMLVIEVADPGPYRKLAAVAGRTKLLGEMFGQVEAIAACARKGELSLAVNEDKEKKAPARQVFATAVLKIGEVGEADASFSARRGEDGSLAVVVTKITSFRAVQKKAGGHH